MEISSSTVHIIVKGVRGISQHNTEQPSGSMHMTELSVGNHCMKISEKPVCHCVHTHELKLYRAK